MTSIKQNLDLKDLSNRRYSGFSSNTSFNFSNENINSVNNNNNKSSLSQLGGNGNFVKRKESLSVLSEKKEDEEREEESQTKNEPSKKSQLDILISQLKDHYYIDEFFVDPDKKFISLLKNLINFFEEDSLLQQVQQNEALYFAFKKKYDDAVEFIKSIKDVPSLVSKIHSSPLIEDSNNRLYPQSSTVSNRKYVFFEGNTKQAADFSFGQASNVKSSMGEVVFSEVACGNEVEINKIIQIYKKDYDKLKEDYIIMSNERKLIEEQVVSQESLRLELKSLSEENYNLKIGTAEMKERIERNRFEIQEYQRRIKLLENDYQRMKENYTLVKNAVGYADEEKILYKNKFNDQVSKMKALERENVKLKKKNVSLNEDIKRLEDRLDVEIEEKALLEDKIEELKEEVESKEKDNEYVVKALKEGEIEVFDDLYNKDKLIVKVRLGRGEEGEKSIEFDDINYTSILNKRTEKNESSANHRQEIPKLRLDVIKPVNMKKTHVKLKNWSFSNRRNMSINGQGHIINTNESTLRLNTDNSIIVEEKGVSLNILDSNKEKDFNDDEERLNINNLLTCESNEKSRTMKKIQTIQSSEKKDEKEEKDDNQKSFDFQNAIINTNLKTRFIVSQKEKGGLRRMLSFIEDDYGSISQKRKDDFENGYNNEEVVERKVMTCREGNRYDNNKLMLEKSQCVSMIMNKEKEKCSSKWREVLNFIDESIMFVPYSCMNRLDETIGRTNRTMIENETIEEEDKENMNGYSFIRDDKEKGNLNKGCKYI